MNFDVVTAEQKKNRSWLIRQVIDRLENDVDNFFMAIWCRPALHDMSLNECPTAACIGGWMEVILAKKQDRSMVSLSELEEFMGATTEHLFHMDFKYSMGLFDMLPAATRKAVAIDVLKHFRRTGKSDWKRALKLHGVEDCCTPESRNSDEAE